ncbi:hypothetical protein [Streptomyces sp. NPDC046862]|uniref:hypothetical protein n=1 Tax=Streptomyces sp. NPDC046862 TaxID=3154603 RepID=UPI003454FABA
MTGQEPELASLLLAQLPEPDLASVHDGYAAALDLLVAAKQSGKETTQPVEPKPAADLIATLEASLRAAADHRSGQPTSSP